MKVSANAERKRYPETMTNEQSESTGPSVADLIRMRASDPESKAVLDAAAEEIAALARQASEAPPLNVYVDRAKERFISAATGTPPTDEQREASRAIGEAVVALAVVIDSHVPNSRNKSLAQTALEDVQMRANRAIYATGPSA